MNLNRGKKRLSVEFRDGSESFVFRTSINCLNADEAGRNLVVIPSAARDLLVD